MRPAPQPAYRSHFYPRPPRGGRQRGGAVLRLGDKFLSTPSARRATGVSNTYIVMTERFLSTPSARRATLDPPQSLRGVCISIHALREEGDAWRWLMVTFTVNFYPRPPRGGRHETKAPWEAQSTISIHALREEGDTITATTQPRSSNFYPRPPRGGRLNHSFQTLAYARFLSTPSARRATAKTETKSLFSNKLYNILHEFRRALIYNGSKSYPNHAK